MQKLPDCAVCGNLRIIHGENDEYRQCECIVKFKIANIGAEFLPSQKPLKRTVEVAKRVYEQDLSIVSIGDLQQVNPFMLLLIGEAVFQQKSIAVLKSYLLLDIYLGGTGAGKEARSVYDYAHDVLVIVHTPRQVPNKIEWSLIAQMVDYYKRDRKVLVVVAGTKDQKVVGEAKQIAALHNVAPLFA
jgi:hypothetical protein